MRQGLLLRSDGEVRDVVVEARQQLPDNRLNNGVFIVAPGKRPHGLERLPDSRDNHFGFAWACSRQHPGVDKSIDRAEMGQNGLWEVVAAVPIDAGLSPVALPDANDLVRHRALILRCRRSRQVDAVNSDRLIESLELGPATIGKRVALAEA